MSQWNPFGDLDVLRQDMNRLFDGYGRRPRLSSVFLPGSGARAYPRINLYEGPEAVRVVALAPGLDPESLEVTVKGDSLVLSGEKRPLKGVERQAYHRSERATGRFVRAIRLGSEIEDEKVEAVYRNGILNVTLPKSERAKPRQIAVSVK